MYQNKVTFSLASMHDCKMAYLYYLSFESFQFDLLTSFGHKICFNFFPLLPLCGSVMNARSLNVKKVIELLLPVFPVCFSSLPARSPHAVLDIINEACSVKPKMAEYWPRSFLSVFFTVVLDFVSVHKNAKKNLSPHVRESRTVLDSGFHVVDSRFQVLDFSLLSVD